MSTPEHACSQVSGGNHWQLTRHAGEPGVGKEPEYEVGVMRALLLLSAKFVSNRPVAEGAWGGAVPPQQEIRLTTCPTKSKFALADFNHFLPKLQMTLVNFKMVMPFSKK